MNNDIEFMASTVDLMREITGIREVDISEEVAITTVTGSRARGHEIISRIHEKANTYIEKYGHEAKYLILDSQSYLDFLGYTQSITIYNGICEIVEHNILGLTPIVLPQVKRRIQVIGDDPMFTATQTLSEQQNR